MQIKCLIDFVAKRGLLYRYEPGILSLCMLRQS